MFWPDTGPRMLGSRAGRLVGLDRAVDIEFDAIVRYADPLTKLLLRRD
jgi:hypothetical protein